MSRNDDKKLRRIRWLVKNYGYVSAITARNYTQNCFSFEKCRYIGFMEAHKLFDELKFTEGDRVAYWRSCTDDYHKKRGRLATGFYKLYNSMPSPPRKDNKDYFSTGGSDPCSRRWGGNFYPTIRYPKKVRKTAWKRFLKLFPFAIDKR
jgi:hypothetical protein